MCEDNFAVPDFCVTRGHRISPNSNVFGTIHQRGVASFDDREQKLLRRAWRTLTLIDARLGVDSAIVDHSWRLYRTVELYQEFTRDTIHYQFDPRSNNLPALSSSTLFVSPNLTLLRIRIFSGEVESKGGVCADMHASRPAGHARLRTVRPGNTIRWVNGPPEALFLFFYLLSIFRWALSFPLFHRLTDKMRSDGPMSVVNDLRGSCIRLELRRATF